MLIYGLIRRSSPVFEPFLVFDLMPTRSCPQYHVYTNFSFFYFQECGGTIDARVDQAGAFSHPNYPANYQSRRECVYIIKTSPGNLISLSFDKFKLEASAQCLYDFFQVRDGQDANAKSLGKFCGSQIPAVIKSSGDSLFVKFFSDDSTVDTGFVAKWKVDIDNTLPTPGPTPG